jgi:hypothetical protein
MEYRTEPRIKHHGRIYKNKNLSVKQLNLNIKKIRSVKQEIIAARKESKFALLPNMAA